MKFKNCLATLAAVSTFGMAGSAHATLSDWFLDSDGAGSNAAVAIHDFLDLTGSAYVHNTFSDATSFTFNEVGNFTTFSADSTTALSPALTAAFVATGAGTAGGALSFLTGSLTVKSGATTIGVFDLLTGSANLFANSTLPNGTVSIIFQATSLMSGYFFDGSMNDLSDVLVSNPLIFGFATTNALIQNPLGQNIPASLLTQYNSAFNPDVVGPIASNLTTDLYLSNNGQFRLSVPEPGSLALLGLGLLGLFGIRRRGSEV